MTAEREALKLGYLAYRAGDLGRAEEAARRRLGEDGSDAEGWLLLGLIALARKQPREAAGHFREAVRLDPASAEVHNHLGRAEIDGRQAARAVASLREALRLRPAYPEAHFNLGVAYQALGREDEALAEYRECVRLGPDHAEALNALGRLLSRRDELKEAAELLERAVRARPGYSEACTNLSWAYSEMGQHEKALACAEEALRDNSGRAEAHDARGKALLGLGRGAEAAASFARAVELKPGLLSAHCNLGAALLHLRCFAEAEAFLLGAHKRFPKSTDLLTKLARARIQQGKWEESARASRQALAINPWWSTAYCDLGHALVNLKQPVEAALALREGLRLNPGFAEGHCDLGIALADQSREAEALQPLLEAVRLKPDLAVAFTHLGRCYLRLEKAEEAREAFETAVRLNPRDARAFGGLASTFLELGRNEESLACYRKSLELDPHNASTHSKMLLALHRPAGVDPEEIFREHRRWQARHAGHLPPPAPHANDRDPDRRIRLGYVCGEFRYHVMGFYIEPVLAAHDRSRFEIFCYSNTSEPDATTARIRDLADHWRDITDLGDDAAAALVRQDGIDLLVDLNGHTGANRLGVFARKPAPVQAAHFGYVETTGLDAMDYYITDAVCDPPGKSERYYAERLGRLPEILWHYAPNVDLAVGPLPALAAGHVTFGVMNSFAKITPPAVAAWAQILRVVPGSRLNVLAGVTPQADQRLLAEFAGHGIGADRVHLLTGRLPRDDYLRLYQALDLALDTFPYNGCNTTCDSLWMGVPVVCLAGHHGIARQGASPLVHLGLHDLVAETPEAYMAAAARLARDLPRLAELRAGLRERMARATLTNSERFTRQLEDVYRLMWRDYCARGPAAGANGTAPAPDAAPARPDPAAEALADARQCFRRGDLPHAGHHYRRALEADPDNLDARYELGLVLHRAGRLAEASDSFRAVVEARPGHGEAWTCLGAMLLAQGKLAEAVDCQRQAVRARPDLADAHNNLGDALLRQGKPDQAADCFKEAVRLQPERAPLYFNLGAALAACGRDEEAVAAFREAVRRDPDFADAHASLAAVLARRGEKAEAVACHRRALALRPDDAAAHNSLGAALLDDGKPEEAVGHFREALRLQPESLVPLMNLGQAYLQLKKLDEALECFEGVVRRDPGQAYAHAGLGVVLSELGRQDEAVAAYRKCLELKPADPLMHSNLLRSLHYVSGWDPEEVFQEHRRWAARHVAHLPHDRSHPNDGDPDRRLRLGYVSADFRAHVMGMYIESVLAARDRTRFETFCYSNVDLPDATTERIRKAADHWRDITRLSDDQVAELVRQDRIDLLIDLGGHTGRSRLPVFGYKPAPVQAAHFGYMDTTGLDTIDYYITDAVCDPPGKSERYHTERVIRMPEIHWLYVPGSDLPPGPLPALATGHVTFGVTNSPQKVTPEAVACWSRVLHAVPDSRMTLLAGVSPRADERLLAEFARHGIGPARLKVVGRQSRSNYLRLYQGIDICLDTFPYTGCNTTCDSLWMGVPVVCLAGHHGIARQGASPLVHLGLRDLVVETPEAYVAAAARLARDLPRLVGLRAGLRERMARATLTNSERFTRQLEDLYRLMWRDYCARGPAAGAGQGGAPPPAGGGLAATRPGRRPRQPG
jgi:predicted O-linked N-acetylglucosamine transferase (SPINDLY family)